MHVNVQLRYDARIGDKAPYYRLKESYRDVRGNVHSLIVLNIGFEPELCPMEMRKIAKALTVRFENRHSETLFPKLPSALTDKERMFAERYWTEMIRYGQIDRFDKAEGAARKEAEDYVDVNTVEHTDAREVGAEWLVKQTIDKLQLPGFLLQQGWTKQSVDTFVAHLTVRTVYSPSELASYRIMAENSAACELASGSTDWMPGFNALYAITSRIYELKEKVERHLCSVTDNLFNLENRIMLFDLTNFYFEGRKSSSRKAKFGRSKEKRSDCRLLVLALCINKEGFIRYSSVLEGNAADPKSLPDMVENLAAKTLHRDGSRTLVVIDAGIATEDNLLKIKEKGYSYLCVSRTKLKNYGLDTERETVTVRDARKQPISLHRVDTDPSGDIYLEVTSPSKAMTEASMNRLFRMRFEEELTKINNSITAKGGTKKYEKVVERTGRAIQKYPSISRHYDIEYIADADHPGLMKEVRWSIKDLSAMESGHGVYFLRTNVPTFDERATWDYYNLIREIECTNRQLKTDLSLRPIYHKDDSRADAHLFFGLLAYWVVNTIRHQLKQTGENAYWTEIVRRMSTQKLVTTEAVNALGERVKFRQCSRPSGTARKIYDALHLPHAPFKKIKLEKICRTQAPPD